MLARPLGRHRRRAVRRHLPVVQGRRRDRGRDRRRGSGRSARADLDADYACEVTAEGLTAERAEPVEVLPPSIVGEYPQTDGQPYVGRAITCDRGRWNDSEALPYSYTYRWERERRGLDADPRRRRPDLRRAVDRRRPRAALRRHRRGRLDGRALRDLRRRWQAVELDADRATTTRSRPAPTTATRLTLRNPNPVTSSCSTRAARLPDGFTYTPGSTTGSTTADPEISSGGFLRWRNGPSIEAGGKLSFDVVVTASATAGHFFADAAAATRPTTRPGSTRTRARS